MDRKMEDMLYEALKPANEPEPELNRRILDRRLERDMRKFNIRKAAVAAAIGILVTAGGVSAYAASQNVSLLSLFQGESKEVRKSAEELLDTEVKQEKGSNKEQSQLATFQIREAIADRNQVRVQVAVKAAESEKYLLVPDGIESDMSVDNLRKDGLKGDRTIADYAESLGKKCLTVGAYIQTKMQTTEHHTEEDGTMVFNIEYKNDRGSKKLNYVCETCVYPSEADYKDRIQDEIAFALTDQTDVEQVKYVPVRKGKISGTDLVLDEVIFDKSDLEMICNVKYHYAGKKKDWSNTKEYDMCFFLLDSQGKVVESTGGSDGSVDEGTKVTQSWQYSLTKLPKTISFQVKDVMEKKAYGTVELKLAK